MKNVTVARDLATVTGIALDWCIERHRRVWKRLPVFMTTTAAVHHYGRLLHRLVRAHARRRQYFGTFFLRNRPVLTLIRRLTEPRDGASTAKVAFLGCSNGAEVYSFLWAIRSGRPDLHVLAHAVDISPDIIAVAARGVYSLSTSGVVQSPIFARVTDTEMRQMFDIDHERNEVSIKPWLKAGIVWRVADATSPEIADVLDSHDLVVANNFLCHMPPRTAENCLRNIARLVSPGGYLVVSGIDLDVRTRVARQLGWVPVVELVEAIHDGDPSVRNDWPCEYWGLEPLDPHRPDWPLRYASVFQMPSASRWEGGAAVHHSPLPRRGARVAFFGNFGSGNLGNESTLGAILHHVRQHIPDAELKCICTVPDAAASLHGVATVDIRARPAGPRVRRTSSLVRRPGTIVATIRREVRHWLEARRTLKGTDMLIVPGTQFLSDNLSGPWGWPYMVLKWSVAARLRRCTVVFVSVGVGPLRHRLSRNFVRAALSLARFRSYRDEASRRYAQGLGLRATRDPVYPDLAFGLPARTTIERDDRGDPVIAIGVKDYAGQYGHAANDAPEETYRDYIERMTTVLVSLLDHGYTVRLVIGDVVYDTPVVADLRKAVLARRLAGKDGARLICAPIRSADDLLDELAQSDIVVSPRFHNVILALLLSRPVIALSYHEKFRALMESVGLARYALPIEEFDAPAVLTRVRELETDRRQLQGQIAEAVRRHRRALDEQYGRIFGPFRCA